MATRRTKRRQWAPAKTYIADVMRDCSRCRQPIEVGAVYQRDQAGSWQHPECKRNGVITERVVRPLMRPNFADVGKPCVVCTDLITEDDLPVPHRGGLPMHGGCR